MALKIYRKAVLPKVKKEIMKDLSIGANISWQIAAHEVAAAKINEQDMCYFILRNEEIQIVPIIEG